MQNVTYGGDHDEAIKLSHTEYIAAAIPGAGLQILPNITYFAFLAGPEIVQLRDAVF